MPLEGTTKHETRVQGVEGSRIQVKGNELKTLEPQNPGILEPFFRIETHYQSVERRSFAL